jgi:hypothetical protein
MIMIFGEITTKADVNYEQVIRDAIKQIGYDDVEKGAFHVCVPPVTGPRVCLHLYSAVVQCSVVCRQPAVPCRLCCPRSFAGPNRTKKAVA